MSKLNMAGSIIQTSAVTRLRMERET